MTAYCFGRDLSEARFVHGSGKPVQINDEANIKAMQYRPSVALVSIDRVEIGTALWPIFFATSCG